MSEIPEYNKPLMDPSTAAIEHLQAMREAQKIEVERVSQQLVMAKKELGRLDKAIKQWEPKEEK